MEHKYLLIKQLIDKVEAFEKYQPQKKDWNLHGFSRFLAEQNLEQGYNNRDLAGPLEPEIQEQGRKQETDLAILVTFIYRYAKLYAKKVLQHSEIATLDDFSYLIVLLTHPSLSKTELIQKNVHEKTTGMEIIKRLIKVGFVNQFDDLDDKRSQRVSITEQGKVAVLAILKELEKVSDLMTGNLSLPEKNFLSAVLKKLDHFHYDIYLNHRDKSLDDLLSDKIDEV